MNKKRQRNPHTLVLPNEDKATSGRLSPRGDAKPLMRPAHNVTQVVSPYCQSTHNLLWPPCAVGQAIIFSSCRLCSIFFLSSFFGCLPYFHTWCGLSANLRCRSETCCTRLTENTGRKKVDNNRYLDTIAQLCCTISVQLRHVSTIEKKTC